MRDQRAGQQQIACGRNIVACFIPEVGQPKQRCVGSKKKSEDEGIGEEMLADANQEACALSFAGEFPTSVTIFVRYQDYPSPLSYRMFASAQNRPHGSSPRRRAFRKQKRSSRTIIFTAVVNTALVDTYV